MCLFSLMFIVVGVFLFVSYSYYLSTHAAIGKFYLPFALSRGNNICFSHLIWMALSLGIWGEKT